MTLTEFSNIALEDIGAKPINSLDDGDFNAQRVKRRIYRSIEDVAAMRDWNCLKKTVKLVPKNGKTHRGETRFIRPVGLSRIIEAFPCNDWRLHSDEILSFTEEMSIDAVIVSHDPSEWDVNFFGAVLAKLKTDIVLPITGSADVASQVIGLSQQAITKYMRQDIYNDATPRRLKKTNWLF